MAKVLFTDNAQGTLYGTLSSGGTTLVLESGQGNLFPAPTGSDYFYLTLYQKDGGAQEIRREVVRCTSRTADALTIVRDVLSMTGTAGGYAYPGAFGTTYVELRWLSAAAQTMMQAGDLTAANTSFTPVGNLSSSNVQAALAELDTEKSATGHTHTPSQVGLSNVNNTADLDKPISTATQAALNNKANTAHSHVIADTTGLQAALDGKAAASHTHTASQVTDLGTAATKNTGTGAGQIPLAEDIPGLAGGGSQVGDVKFVPATVAPTGWIKANGALLSRTTYSALWAYAQASGNLAASDGAWQDGQFSPGDGSTTFRVPDLRGNVIRGFDDGRGIDTGRVIGTLQSDQNKSHTHTGTAASAGAHQHTLRTGSTGGSSGASVSGPDTPAVYSGSTNNTGAHTHTLTIDANGGTEVRVRNIAWLAVIKY